MTASFDSPIVQAALSFGGLSFYRSLVGTPLEGIAKREVLQASTTLKVIRTTPFPDLWKGLQPNLLKNVSKTYVQIVSVRVASLLAPTQLEPKFRGALMGLLSSSLEVSVQNIWNVLATRFIQGQGWNVVRKEGISLFYQGLSPALIHRASSGAIFWSAYEKLNQINPNHPALSGTGAGLIQVFLTSPLYQLSTNLQSKNRPPGSLIQIVVRLGKDQGWFRGLFLRALLPRMVLSIATSGPLMTLIEKHKVVHR